jgi:hypothetical protein
MSALKYLAWPERVELRPSKIKRSRLIAAGRVVAPRRTIAGYYNSLDHPIGAHPQDCGVVNPMAWPWTEPSFLYS